MPRDAANVVELRGEVIIALEAWTSIAPEADALGAKHFAEVNAEQHVGRRFRLDHEMMSLLHRSGHLRIISARKAGRLVGYFTWTIQYDIESVGLLVAEQGAWFLEADVGRRVAWKMWRRSLAELRRLGVQVVYPHHHFVGRGAGLGNFFLRQGAVPVKTIYALWIGEAQANG